MPDATAAQALLALYSDLQWSRPRPWAVDEYSHLSADDFFDRYFAANRPVALRGAFSSSEAVARWSPDYFARNYRDVPIVITAERGAAGDYETHFGQTVRTVLFGEFAERLDNETGNDFYLVARNNFFENPQLSHLRDHLAPPAGIIDDHDRSPGSVKLWIGPEGTVTPLHFDEHSILFAQLYGIKHVKLIPSSDYSLLYVRDRYYSEIDPESVDVNRHPGFARACIMDITLGPGDGLFLPAGWWHWVRSLSTSISATFSSFQVDRTRPWHHRIGLVHYHRSLGQRDARLGPRGQPDSSPLKGTQFCIKEVVQCRGDDHRVVRTRQRREVLESKGVAEVDLRRVEHGLDERRVATRRPALIGVPEHLLMTVVTQFDAPERDR